MAPSSASGAPRLALAAGIGCYLTWGLMPLLFQGMARLGVGSWEALSHRSVWAVPVALAFVMLARQGGQALALIRRPPVLGALALSAAIIGLNWVIFIWAVNNHRVLETSLGYFITPLLNMAAGALLFRERLDRLGLAAIALAACGVILQTVALGHLPWVSLVLAISFGVYGIIRKTVPADAQTGLLIECLFLAAPGLVYILWLETAGDGHTLQSPLTFTVLLLSGLGTALPLMLFSWAARRMPLSAMGFLQFIAPSMTFVMGSLQGEALTPLRIVSFVFIWAGGALFAYGAWRAGRARAGLAAQIPA